MARRLRGCCCVPFDGSLLARCAHLKHEYGSRPFSFSHLGSRFSCALAAAGLCFVSRLPRVLPKHRFCPYSHHVTT
eukprot:4718548-Prymnesium_polylepis.1